MKPFVTFLVQIGANVSALIRRGFSPLDFTISAHVLDHLIVQLFIYLGGVSDIIEFVLTSNVDSLPSSKVKILFISLIVFFCESSSSKLSHNH
jgi:hypothetical protein